MCDARESRGIMIAAICKIVQKGSVWLVPSQSSGMKYTVVPDAEHPHCSCPDHGTRDVICKHIHAVRLVIKRESNGDITETLTETKTVVTTKKATYKQDWPAYNKAQVNEKRHFQELLKELCLNVEEPIQKGRGQRQCSLRDVMFASIFKIYTTLSTRRFMTDLNDAKDKGYLHEAPAYNSICRYLESEAMTPILMDLIVKSSLPFKSIDTTFAVDSSGFSSSKFDRWVDEKYGNVKVEHSWVKCHIASGTKSHVITACEIFEKNTNDSPVLPMLLETTARNFTISEVLADKAYQSINNFESIVNHGADPYIQFPVRATGGSRGLFGKAFHFFSIYREDFLKSYHQRSNVESTFSMVKRKFCDGVRSRMPVAMKNEVLAKIVAHNLCCVIQAMYEMNLVPILLPESNGIAISE